METCRKAPERREALRAEAAEPRSENMAEVILKNIKKVYPNSEPKKKSRDSGEKKHNLQITDEGVVAVQEFNLDIADREFIVLVGPSGCGKSTTLRMVAGLEEISAGELYIDGKLMNDVAPKDRDIAMVFQNYALYPHMTVYENMAFSLKLKKVPKDEIDRKVREAAEILDITQYLDRKPKALSGGQRQRVAIGRAIVRDPKVFLMDEPLSNLDARLRLQTREEIRRIQKETKITTVFVTHDQEEAMSISDMIVVMKFGVVQQIGKPQEVYDNPANLFVANFLGTPPINIFTGHVKGERLYIGTDSVMDVPGVKDQDVFVGIRPEGFILDMANGTLCCKPQNVEVMGRDVSVVSTHEASQKPMVRSIIDADNKVDASADVVRYRIKPHKIFLFTRDDEGVRIPFEVK